MSNWRSLLTPTSTAELTTTSASHYARKLCSTPSWSAATACRLLTPLNGPGLSRCPISTTGPWRRAPLRRCQPEEW